jgi:hypothetical protein
MSGWALGSSTLLSVTARTTVATTQRTTHLKWFHERQLKNVLQPLCIDKRPSILHTIIRRWVAKRRVSQDKGDGQVVYQTRAGAQAR